LSIISVEFLVAASIAVICAAKKAALDSSSADTPEPARGAAAVAEDFFR
jgi:hypothetical protein